MTLCSCLVCVKERIGIEMPLDCIYKEKSKYPPSPPNGEVCRRDEVCRSQLEIINGDYVLGRPSVWITVKAPTGHDISLNIRQDEEGVKIALFPLNHEEGTPLAACEVDFPPRRLESKTLVTDYGYRLGWSPDSQLDVLSDFINNKNLEGALKSYLDNLADEEVEEAVAADHDARGEDIKERRVIPHHDVK